MRKWAIWIPVLLVASMLFWTVALGLGGLSLMVVSSLDCGSDDAAGDASGAGSSMGSLKDSYEPITVNLVESAEGAAVEVEDAPDAVSERGGAPCRLPRRDQGPGATAF